MNDSKLLAYKAQYGSVYSIVLEEYSIYYRTLTSWEVQSIIELQKNKATSVDVEVAACCMAVLHPSEVPTFKRPGTISALFLEIWGKTLPTESTLEGVADASREWAEAAIDSNFAVALACLMCKMLPSLSLTDLLSLSVTKLIRIAALVEEITGSPILGGIDQIQQQASAVQEGMGVTQEQADKTNRVLQQALSDFKNTN
ncbi:hypothetical protein H8D85_02730 [bacterium]|nr:hypothetical protein [bacterium]